MKLKNMEPPPKANAQIGIRVTSAFKISLARQAEREQRSVSNLVVKVLKDYLSRQEEAEQDAKPPL
ncbi:hypothetical protein CE91St41_00620 [Oscillospiraceae bacterium]|nr:hypothetical protein CE91St40_00620 [Oscillospiraceae bacterium]BDF73173.1 hypothetical protein CE91St41_00620 [Oscillospiraceae bacterium]